MKSKAEQLLKSSIESISNIKASTETLFASLTEQNILKLFDELKFASAKVYDKAMDANYIDNKVGGGNHRLFDGGHSLTDAWDRVQKANPDDTFIQEVVGFMKAIWNDGSTIKGLPFQTLEKANYEAWVDSVTKVFPGISKEWLYDLTSFDAAEVAGTTAGFIVAIFQLKNDDKEKFDQLLGSMGISSIMGANPIMGVVTIALAGYAYFYKKNKFDKKAFSKSAAATAFASGVFLLLGLPFLIELIVVVVAGHYFKKKVINNDELLALLSRHGAEKLGIAKEKFIKLVEKIKTNYASRRAV